jgi:hypothetical protein
MSRQRFAQKIVRQCTVFCAFFNSLCFLVPFMMQQISHNSLKNMAILQQHTHKTEFGTYVE